MMLIFILGPNWLSYYFGFYEIRVTHGIICKLHHFLTYWLADICPWLLVAITWERVLAINFPHKIQAWTSRKKTYTYIATLLIFFAAINFHWFFAVKLFIFEDGSRHCDPVSEAWEYYSYFIFSYIDLAKYAVLPFLAIAIGNILIIRRIIYAKRMARQQLNVSNANSSQISSITFMLVGVSTVFLVLNLPVALTLILEGTGIEFNDYQYAGFTLLAPSVT